MRKYFIDNIRWIIILMLPFYHSIMIYNTLGLNYYILHDQSNAASCFQLFFSGWIMPLLFLLAGCSAKYSLEKRTIGQYTKERFTKLLIPFVAGVTLLAPIVGYFGNCWHNGFTGSYWEEYVIFFTNREYTFVNGGFDVGHFWFIAFLFGASLITLPVLIYAKRKEGYLRIERLPFWGLMLAGVLFTVLAYLVPLPIDKNPLITIFLFLLGYFCISREDIQEKVRRFRVLFTVLFLASYLMIICSLYVLKLSHTPLLGMAVSAALSWFGMLSAIGWGVQFFNHTNRAFRYLTTASYGFYFFHQAWVIGISYLLITAGVSPLVHLAITIPVSYVVTFLTYEVVRRIPGIRWIFALKPPKKA